MSFEHAVLSARQSRNGGISARILHFGNGAPPVEVNCATAFQENAQVFRIADDYTSFIDDRRETYSVIFIVGSDPGRIRKFMRIYRPLLKSKAKIALLRDARPQVRAQILNVGFDDVFDVEMDPTEGQARIKAILGRMGQRQTDDLLRNVRQLHLQHYVISPLLGRESRILSLLAAAKGAPVRTERLTATGRSALRPISPKSLQVLISGLRAKLKPTISIMSHGSSGYALLDASPVAELLATAAVGAEH
ncbi:response regulator transcription factor [Novosphingobium taihuense]|uniref:hypothetical protein n=1 Tax=Novosphingobium taihuense TaxID=260085 RepID=UPI0013156B18|nr:hypothetical protein [Novosphingobium taihuense]